MTLKAIVLAGALGAATLFAGAANATTTLTETQQSWLTATDSGVAHGIFNPIVGFCGAGDCAGARIAEYRDFFKFSIPVLTAPLASATLVVDAGLVILNQSSSITVQFTSTAAQTFASLGNGVVFATQSFTSADNGKTFNIALDAAALAAIGAAQGGTFEISGRAISPFSTASTASDQLTLAGNTPAQLVLTPVPEPAAWLLLTAGFSSLGAALRRRRAMARAGAAGVSAA